MEFGSDGAAISLLLVSSAAQAPFGLAMQLQLWRSGSLLAHVPMARSRLMLVAAGVCNVAGSLALIIGIDTDPQSKGVIASVMPIQTVVVTLACCLLFKERLKWMHVVGMFLGVFGVVMMAIGKLQTPALYSSLKGVLWGVLCAIGYAVVTVLTKVGCQDGCSPAAVIAIISWTCGLIGVGGLFVAVATGFGLQGVDDTWLVWLCGACGILEMLGFAAVAMAMKAGGPSGAISTVCNARGCLVLGLDYLFFNPEVSPMQLAGILVVFVGVACVSLVRPEDLPAMTEDACPAKTDEKPR